MSEGGNSNSSSEKEDALKREPLLPIVCLPFWKKRREGWAEGVESWTLSTVFCSNS